MRARVHRGDRHSGAFRTLQAWLDEPTLDHITMVDAMYGEEELIAAWLRASPTAG